MNALTQIRNAISSIATPAQWLIDYIGGDRTESGVRIDHYTSLTIPTVWQAVKVISGDVGQLPLSRYRREGDDGRVHEKDPLMEIRPNKSMTPLKFKETLQAHALMLGNGYALINRTSRRGQIGEILVLDPRHVTPEHNSQNELIYKYQDIKPDGEFVFKTYKADDIVHIRGLGFDGLLGYSVVALARECFGMAKAAENHGATFFKNYATPQGILKFPGGKPKQETVEQTREDWTQMQSGENKHKVGMLWGGAEFTPLSFTNEEAQFLQSREFQRTEIASWFNLPPHKVGDLSRATFTNIEEQNRDYLTTSLMYWLVTWQEECSDKLLSDREKDQGYYYEFNTSALLKGDTQSRFEAYGKGIQDGWLNRNEVRIKENMNPVEGLDEYLVPLNMSAVGSQEEFSNDSTQDETSNIIEAAVTGIVRMEGNRIVKTSETAKNFTEAVDKFYAQFADKLWELIEPMGATVATLDAYIAKSKHIWSEITGGCTKSELTGAIEQINGEWSSRAGELTRLIIEDRNNAKEADTPEDE